MSSKIKQVFDKINVKTWFRYIKNTFVLLLVLSLIGILFMIYLSYAYFSSSFRENFVNELPGTTILMSKEDAFCENHLGSSETLEKSCGLLTRNNCNKTSCCVWTSEDKCVAGDAGGPTFNTDANGKTIEMEYSFQNNSYHT
jgi:hypothetical protein